MPRGIARRAPACGAADARVNALDTPLIPVLPESDRPRPVLTERCKTESVCLGETRRVAARCVRWAGERCRNL